MAKLLYLSSYYVLTTKGNNPVVAMSTKWLTRRTLAKTTFKAFPGKQNVPHQFLILRCDVIDEKNSTYGYIKTPNKCSCLSYTIIKQSTWLNNLSTKLQEMKSVHYLHHHSKTWSLAWPEHTTNATLYENKWA